MKKLHIASLLLGATLFTGIGALSLSASEMKCGAGKCGGSMDMPSSKCGAKKSNKKCGSASKDTKVMKCGAGKCGKAMKESKTMKCGAGKCGSKK